MSVVKFKGPGSGQISLIICIILAAGLWLTQQFSKEYQRWLNFPIKVSLPAEDDSNLEFDAETIRLRIRQSGWFWAFDSQKGKLSVTLDWKDLQATQWDRSRLYDLIISKLPIEPEDILEMDGLDLITDLRGTMSKRVPLRILTGDTNLPSGYILSDFQLILPDSIYLIGSDNAIDQYEYWPVELPENLEIKTGNEIVLSLKHDYGSQLFLSHKQIKWIPQLDQMTEKKWEIKVLLPDSIRGKYLPIPGSVQLTAQLPASKFDSDSLRLISAVLTNRDSLHSDDLQVLEVTPLPSFIKNYRLSPPFVSIFRIDE